MAEKNENINGSSSSAKPEVVWVFALNENTTSYYCEFLVGTVKVVVFYRFCEEITATLLWDLYGENPPDLVLIEGAITSNLSHLLRKFRIEKRLVWYVEETPSTIMARLKAAKDPLYKCEQYKDFRPFIRQTIEVGKKLSNPNLSQELQEYGYIDRIAVLAIEKGFLNVSREQMAATIISQILEAKDENL